MKRSLITGLLALSGAALAVGAPAGSTISNTGYLDYSTDDTTAGPKTATSNTVNIQVQQVYGVSVTPNGTATAPGQTYNTDPGTNGVLKYVLTNTGNGADSYVLSTFAQSANVTAANVKYYDDTNGNGSYDAGTDLQITGYTNLAADTTTTPISKTFFAVYPVAAGTAAITNFDIDPQAKSVAGGTAAAPAGPTDNDNYGRVAVNSIYDLSLASSNTGTVNVLGTKTYTETLTNTGNVSVTASQLNVTGAVINADKAGAALAANAFTVSYTATYKGNSATATDPQTAISNALNGSNLAATETVTLQVNVTAPTGRQDGDKNTDVLTALAVVTTSTTVKNNAATANTNNQITDVTTVTRGVATFFKTQALCPTVSTCPNSASAVSTDVNAKPGDYIAYYLKANNTGSGNLLAVKLRDTIPLDTVMYSIGASITGFTGTPTVLYSTDGTTWKTSTTALGNFTAGTTVLYVGVDTNADNTITAADIVPAGAQILVRIKVKVRDAAAAPSAPVTDSQTVQ